MATMGVDQQKKVIPIDSQATKPTNMLVTLWDTIGQETHGPIPKRFYLGADGILLVYDITKEGK